MGPIFGNNYNEEILRINWKIMGKQQMTDIDTLGLMGEMRRYFFHTKMFGYPDVKTTPLIRERA